MFSKNVGYVMKYRYNKFIFLKNFICFISWNNKYKMIYEIVVYSWRIFGFYSWLIYYTYIFNFKGKIFLDVI